MTDVLLVSPSGEMYAHGRGIFPTALRYAPLTLTTLAGLVPDDLGMRVRLVDEGTTTLGPDEKADLVGITAITGTATRAYAIADHFRRKGSTVVLGGVHPTLLPDEAQAHADAVVTGLAFESWPRLLRDYARGELETRYEQTHGMSLRGLPEPRRDLLPALGYASRASVQATYSCPYRCDFCAVVATQPDYTRRPVEDVIAEIERLPGRFIVFVDPSPMEDREYAKRLMRAMIPLRRRWGGLSTVRIGQDRELMDLAAESGCKGLLLGFEAVYQEGATSVNKGFNRVERYAQVVRDLHDRGIGINGTFIFGIDTDTEDTFARTVDFALEHGIDLPRYSILTPFPSTPLFSRLEREGRITTRDWALYDGQHVVYEPATMSAERLREGLLWAWERTYSLGGIAERTRRSGTNLLLNTITNLGYRHYATRLRRFPGEAMRARVREHNEPFMEDRK
ncbi:MAG: radical SAM protein [Gemmatimonadota bacterium]|jgi:radical SAM superfamily enzyme YgiQ (UPF0313 family)